MAYQRRYFEPFVGTTETIGDKSITEDKIDDGAVETGKLADEAVTSEKIKDETIKSEDLKDGEVKTADLGTGSVTESKLADNSVGTYKYKYQSITGSKIVPGTITADKMAVAQITRPLTPGVDTDEIQDGKVTALKLAGDAVETAKIKDGAVTGAKIDTDTITNANIAADAVQGPEIKDDAVTGAKIGTDAVMTWHIKDENVTEPKLDDDILVDRHIESFLDRRKFFYDNFAGAVLSSRWAQSGDVGGFAAILSPGGGVQIATQNVINKAYRMNWNGNKSWGLSQSLPKMVVKVETMSITDVKVFIGLYIDANNYVGFGLNTAVDGNWRAECMKAAAPTTVDTGIAADTPPMKFKIDYVSGSQVKFYIDDVEKADISTNIPLAGAEAFLELTTLANVSKTFNVRYLNVLEVPI